ncbi:MAG: DnaA N-terminal domain-containing protein, partial [Nitrospirales bacterium]
MNKLKLSNTNNDKVWVDVLDFVSPRVGDDTIETWFQPLILESLNEDQAHIRVPNKFFGEWLGRNYKDLLVEAFNHVEGVKPAEIIFVLKEQDGEAAPKSVIKTEVRENRG